MTIDGTPQDNVQHDFYKRTCIRRTDQECYCAGLCPAGQFSFTGHLPDCRNCPKGYYTSQPGSNQCLACPTEQTTVGEGSTSCVPGAPLLCGLCKNNVTCTVTNNLPMCQCQPGYTGVYCETVIDYCASQPCYHNAPCTSNTNGFTCQCPLGTNGDRCEVNNNDCISSTSCLNGGVCEDGVNSINCHCLPGYTGVNCQIQINICQAKPCQNGGACVAVNQVLRHCNCLTGFTGPSCETNINECDSSPCMNGAPCIQGVGTFTCSPCPEGYRGQLCNIPDRSCSTANCGFATECVDELDVGLPRCLCQQGYSYGQFCQYDLKLSRTSSSGLLGSVLSNINNVMECMTQCESSANRVACAAFEYNSNARTCQLLSSTYSLVASTTSNVYIKQCFHPADDFWTPYYSIDTPSGAIELESKSQLLSLHNINVCGGTTPVQTDCHVIGGGSLPTGVQCTSEGVSCSGSCPDIEVRYRCSLARVFKDKQCIQQDLCSERCDANHICHIVGGELMCKCRTGYTGVNCDQDINECTALSIYCNTGTCNNFPGSYNCSCPSGYTGSFCENVLVPCDSNLCNPGNTANCINTGTTYRCDCKPGFKGDRCDEEINNCESTPCLHDGVCVNRINNYDCVCEAGWTGRKCETPINICTQLGITCSGRGTCYTLFNDYYCQCNGTSSGKNCDIVDNVCTKMPLCYNSATCSLVNEAPQCNCPTGFMGLSCEIRQDYDCINSSPCLNGGTCSIDSTGYKCSCDAGFTGDTCATDINECASANCPTSATCINLKNSHYCKCPAGKALPNCQQNVNLNYDICLRKSLSRGSAMVAFPLSINSVDGFTIGLWVKYDMMGGIGTFLSLYRADSTSTSSLIQPDIVSLDETGIKLRVSGPEVTANYHDFKLNSGRWHAVVISWRSTTVEVYVDSLRQIQVTGYTSSITSTQQIWVSIGSQYPMSKSFIGCVSQLNIYNKILEAGTELPSLFDAPSFVYPSNVYQGWADYILNDDVVMVQPSRVMKGACPTGYTGFPSCSTQTNDKTKPGVDSCPNNVFYQSTNGAGQPTWTEPVFSGASSVTFTQLSGALLTKGPHTIIYEAVDGNKNKALCYFKVYINDEFCPALPVPRNNGIQTCNNINNNWRFTACSVDCPASSSTINKQGKTWYTCSSEGNWVWPPSSQDIYPPCGSIVGPANVDVNVQMNYLISPTDCLTVKSTLNTKLTTSIQQLNTQWNNEICKQTTCSDIAFDIVCNPVTKVTFDVKDIKPELTKGSETLTAEQVLIRATLDENIFTYNDIVNGRIYANTLLVDMKRICPVGQTVIDNQCVTCASGTYYNNVTFTCDDCPKGQYQPATGVSSCTPCGSGKTTQTTGSIALNQCIDSCTIGNFYDVQTTSCQPCAQGLYQDTAGEFSCKPCPVGQITRLTGSTNISQCYVGCNAGYQLVNGQCEPCPIGTYSDDQICQPCPSGNITQTVGADRISNCTVVACEVGRYRTSENQCVECGIGTYQDVKWQTSCKLCGNNSRYRTDTTGASSPTQCRFFCESGYQANPSNTDCVICDVGTYKDNVVDGYYGTCQACPTNFITPATGTTSVSGCSILKCEAGYKGNTANTACEMCPYGTYQPAVNQKTCTNCPVGQGTRRKAAVAQTECEVLCASGSERITPTSECTPCPVGKYRVQSDLPSNICTPCPDGYLTPNTQSEQVSQCTVRNCTAGYKIDGVNCVACPIGQYQSLPYQLSCQSCPSGTTTRNTASSASTDCEDFCVGGEELISGTCTPCSIGFYKDNTKDRFGSCKSCPIDRVTPGRSATSLSDCSLPNCTAGSYIDMASDSCKPCPIGQYQAENWKMSCETCPDQSITLAVGSTSRDQCIISCFAGYESKSGTCVKCGDGFYKPSRGATLCIACPDGFITDKEGAIEQSECSVAACTPGYYLDQPNNNCKPCIYGQYQPIKWQKSCLTCLAGKTTLQVGTDSQAGCVTDCAIGQEYKVDRCQPCGIGYYRDKSTPAQTTCQICPGNFITADIGTTSTAGCNIVNCTTPGQYRKDNQCTYCPIGKYQDVKWQTSCKDCPSGTTTKTEGTRALSSCYKQCPSGQEVNEMTNECQVCRQGLYRVSGETWTCQICPAGFTTERAGAVSLAQCNIPNCNAGTYSDIASGKCIPCPKGTYQTLPIQVSCIPCPNNKMTSREGAASVQECISLCQTGQQNCTAPTTCVDVRGGFECQCQLPYFGTKDNCTHACDSGYCLNGATCRRDASTICYCAENYNGVRCDSRVDAAVAPNIRDVLVGVVVGVICFLLLIIACIIAAITRRRRRAEKAKNEFYPPPSTAPPSVFNGSLSGSRGKGFMPQYDQMTYDPSFYSAK
ncbi:uncharacterized protein LOC126811123 [Patella vulgata]|uniref:uncharacterized protein LOC126811123 n=1 Tax=Patella vulgata TaxID=6465 RepID=UPI0024A8C181|nr:uncharacterized protein LOC126811123 [Patella vulgata]